MIRRNRRTDRPGVILLVVLAMLTIFTIVGISFVYYAEAAATRARIYREAQSINRFGDIRGLLQDAAESAYKVYLGQAVYDVHDDEFGCASAFRGHGLARLVYGWNDPFSSDPNNAAVATTPLPLQDRPWTGTGRLAAEANLVNYTYFRANGSVRDPAYTGARPDPATTARTGRLTGDLNVAYTYPDRNNMFLAMLDPGTLQVQMPSYHRPYLVNPADRRTSLRYLPADMGPGWPTLTGVGDLKNLDYLPGGNDSVWLDFGGPVQSAPDGTKYKVMVAPLLLDMDGRVNLAVAGNVMGAGGTHAGSAGWGLWEVNPTKVSAGNAPLVAEWRNLILGNGTVDGKYGPAPRLPVGTGLTGGFLLRDTFPVDLNGVYEPGSVNPPPGSPSARYTFPQGATALTVFPQYPLVAAGAPPTHNTAAYGQAVPAETTQNGLFSGLPNHASGYNPMRNTSRAASGPIPAGSNRVFGATDLQAILRRYGAEKTASTSDVLTLLPGNLAGTDPASMYRRSLVTTKSFDLDRPGGPPLVWTPAAADLSLGYPVWPPVPFQDPATHTGAAAPAGSDYDGETWKSSLPPLKINVGRPLTPYPPPSDPLTLQYNTADAVVMGQYARALQDRQALAAELYQRLARVTGAPAAPGAVNSPEFRTHRWLAQLAANIVDFVDVDDHPTPYLWYNDGTTPYYVFGTEMPRLVINEYYAQLDNDRANLAPAAMPTKQDMGYILNVYAELYNPSQAEHVTRDAAQGAAVLQHATGKPIYRLRVSRKPNAGIRDSATGATDAPATDSVVDDWGMDVVKVDPSYGAYAGAAKGTQPFFAVGSDFAVGADAGYIGGALPKLMAAEQKMGDQMTRTTPKMKLTDIPLEAAGGTPEPLLRATAPSLVLERLANVSLPEQSDPTQANYNPYITVDYVHSLKVEDGREFDVGAAKVPPLVEERRSVGRAHPFAAFDPANDIPSRANTLWQQANPVPAIAAADKLPQHTLFRHNAQGGTAPTTESATETIKVPFDVLYHPNRIPASVGELLHVSGWKQHELTQQFLTGTFNATARFQHRARWSDTRTRLARLLDHLTVNPMTAGVALNGRVPGKLNVNGVWDLSVFRAYANATAGNQFTESQVDAVFAQLRSRRTPGGVPGNTDEPFLSLSTGYGTGQVMYNGTSGVRGTQNTLLRPFSVPAAAPDFDKSDDIEPRLLEPAAYAPAEYPGEAGGPALTAQAMRRFELMQKLMGNTTTRSNVFGVWVTIGFFRVTDDSTVPARLGDEINWPGEGVIRFRSFAVIDRTQFQMWPTRVDPADPVSTPLCTMRTTLPGGVVAVQPPVRDMAGNVIDATQESQGVLVSFSLYDQFNQVIGSTTMSGVVMLENPNTKRKWVPRVGAVITVDPNTDNEETVVLESVAAGTVQARFRKSHGAGAVVISRGNPGPWKDGYDPTKDPDVLPVVLLPVED